MEDTAWGMGCGDTLFSDTWDVTVSKHVLPCSPARSDPGVGWGERSRRKPLETYLGADAQGEPIEPTDAEASQTRAAMSSLDPDAPLTLWHQTSTGALWQDKGNTRTQLPRGLAPAPLPLHRFLFTPPVQVLQPLEWMVRAVLGTGGQIQPCSSGGCGSWHHGDPKTARAREQGGLFPPESAASDALWGGKRPKSQRLLKLPDGLGGSAACLQHTEASGCWTHQPSHGSPGLWCTPGQWVQCPLCPQLPRTPTHCSSHRSPSGHEALGSLHGQGAERPDAGCKVTCPLITPCLVAPAGLQPPSSQCPWSKPSQFAPC